MTTVNKRAPHAEGMGGYFFRFHWKKGCPQVDEETIRFKFP